MPVARKSAVKMGASRARVVEPSRTEVRPRAVPSDDVDPAFHRAILKIALDLKKPTATSYDQVVATTIKAMRLDAAAFRRYLGENGARNMGLLLATARGGGL